MQDQVVAGVQRDVADHTVLSPEQHQVSFAQGPHRCMDALSCVRHLPRCARKLYAMLAVDVLNEARAVESGGRASSPHIRNADIIAAGCDCGAPGARGDGATAEYDAADSHCPLDVAECDC